MKEDVILHVSEHPFFREKTSTFSQATVPGSVKWLNACPDYNPVEIDYKYNEKNILSDIKTYIDSTYGEHYFNSNIQPMEYIINIGKGVDYLIGNIIKYAVRYGKKDGFNRKDILKLLHYSIILLYQHDLNATEKPLKETK